MVEEKLRVLLVNGEFVVVVLKALVAVVMLVRGLTKVGLMRLRAEVVSAAREKTEIVRADIEEGREVGE